MTAKVRLHLRRRARHLLQVVQGVDDVGGVLRVRGRGYRLEELAVGRGLVVGVQREFRLGVRRRIVGVVGAEPSREPRDRLELVRGRFLLGQRGERLHERGLELPRDVLPGRGALRDRVQAEVREEKLELAHRGCGRVGSVRRVARAVGAELGAQGLGRVLPRGERVRGSHQGAPVLDRVVLREAARHDRPAGHEPHEVGVEGLPLVLGVEFARADGVHALLLAPDDDETRVLGDLEDVIHLSRRHGVGLDHGVGLLETPPFFVRRGHRSSFVARFGN
mmetsp:Transcript_4477/g.20324  ORF Transcript_4477/g.20324 Transcript_4477/m.20324 type:complete len:278 (-) Transcript_4477:151-984(-)